MPTSIAVASSAGDIGCNANCGWFARLRVAAKAATSDPVRRAIAQAVSTNANAGVVSGTPSSSAVRRNATLPV